MTDAEVILIFEMRRQKGSWPEIAAAVGCTQAEAQSAIKRSIYNACKVPPDMTPDLISHEASELLAQVHAKVLVAP